MAPIISLQHPTTRLFYDISLDEHGHFHAARAHRGRPDEAGEILSSVAELPEEIRAKVETILEIRKSIR